MICVRKKAVIFDLDDTLIDSTNTWISKAYKTALEELEKSGVIKEDLRVLDDEYQKPKGFSKSLEKIRDRIPFETHERAMDVYYKNADVSVTRMFPDAHYLLSGLRYEGYKLAIATSGDYNQQKKKLDMFHFPDYVDEVYIDDSEGSTGKSKIFTEFAAKYKLSPEEIVVVGDNIGNEIKAGNELGMDTVRIMRGKYSKLEPVDPSQTPKYTIKNLLDLVHLLEKPIDLTKIEQQ